MDGKSPAFQFYPKDFLTDERVVSMSNTEIGVYMRLMSYCWLEGTIPLETERLAHMARMPFKQFTKFWEKSVVRHCFQLRDDGRLHHKRLDIEREKQERHRATQVENGRKGGRPKSDGLAMGLPTTECEVNPNESEQKLSVLRTASASPEKEREEPVSLSPPAGFSAKPTVVRGLPPEDLNDPLLNPAITSRAAAFITRYGELYVTHRHGARYSGRPAKDWPVAVDLCATWPDDRLDKLAVIFLTTDHKFADEGSRTIPQFRALASWCDGKLAAHEAKKAQAR